MSSDRLSVVSALGRAGCGATPADIVAFIANLMESGVDYVAVDMPQANRLTGHVLAAVAEHEREMTSG